MPILGQYLLKNYLRVFFLCILSFIAILLVSRLEEIAHFAAMGAKFSYLSLFILYQIPYILPIAIPISCLISAMVLFQRLSHTHELTALRSGGFSLKMILSPILVAGFFLSATTFYIASEMATSSHLATRRMVYELTSVNPILLLQSAKIAKLQGAYVQMNPIRNGEAAKELVIALSSDRLTLFTAKKIEMERENLRADRVSLMTTAASDSDRDHFILENQKSILSPAAEFAQLLRKQGWKIANDHLKFSLLRIRSKMLRQEIQTAENDSKAVRNLKKCRSEMARRFSLGLASFTFTLLGAAFGMEISRNQSKRGIIYVFLLAATSLIAFFTGKEFDHVFWFASLLFLLPHVLIVSASAWTLRRVNRGIE